MAVIDGSTSKTDFRLFPSSSNGKAAMMIVRDFISRMPREITCDDFCEAITRHIHYIYIKEGADEELMRMRPERRLTASAVVYTDFHRQVWMVGDCQAIVNGCLHVNEKPYERVVAARRAKYIKEGVPPREARERIVPLLLEAMAGQNVSYAVIDGFSIPRQGVKVIPVEGGEVVLATDGYPFLCPTLAESEARLARQLAVDPDNIHEFQATKGLMPGSVSFDDRAFVRFIP